MHAKNVNSLLPPLQEEEEEKKFMMKKSECVSGMKDNFVINKIRSSLLQLLSSLTTGSSSWGIFQTTTAFT